MKTPSSLRNAPEPMPVRSFRITSPFAACLLALLAFPASSPAREGGAAPSAAPPPAAPAACRLEVARDAMDPAAVRFVPPRPPEPAPRIRAEASSTLRKPTHSITFQRGGPSILPDIPPPPERALRTAAAVSAPPLRPSFLLGLSVTVYDRRLSHLQWRDPQTKEELEAWCGWDWGLVAPMKEVSGESAAYDLVFSPLEIDTSVPDAFGRGRSVPRHPPVSDGGFAIVRGNADAPAGREFLEAVRRHCAANRPALERMRAAREQYRADAEAWKKAHPPRPRNHTVALRPHRGSRYLKTKGLKGRAPVAGGGGDNFTGEEKR